MRTLHWYLIRQVMATLAVTVAVFTLLLLLGSVLKEVLELLTSQAASATLILTAVGLLIPFVLAFSLPMAFLTATLLVFGRFSADQELTAARSAGISLAALVSPIIGISIGFSVLCGWFNLEIAPRCRTAFTHLRDSVVQQSSSRFIGEDRFIDLGGNRVLYAREVRGSQLRDVVIYGTTNFVHNLDVWATDGEVQSSASGMPTNLTLRNLQILRLENGEWQSEFLEQYQNPIDIKPAREQPLRLSDMTFRQLLEERARRRTSGDGPAMTPVNVQLHRQISFSFACIGFTLIGIPLGIRAHRRETNVGVALALGLVLVYYSFLVLGQAFETRPQMHPILILWAPNFLFQGVGVWLLWRASNKS
jgi:lipopolysaccharide export system permease protein